MFNQQINRYLEGEGNEIKKLIIIAFIIITLVGCVGDSEGHEGEAKTPSGSSFHEGREYKEVVDDFKEKGFGIKGTVLVIQYSKNNAGVVGSDIVAY